MYETRFDFLEANKYFPLIVDAFQSTRLYASTEDSTSLAEEEYASPLSDALLVWFNKDGTNSPCKITIAYICDGILKTIPLVSVFYGIGRLCAVWFVKGCSGSAFTKIYHTFVGVLEILGLGIIILALRILVTLLTLLFLGCMFIKSHLNIKCCR